MEVIVPALPYYLVNFGVSLCCSVFGVLLVILWLMGRGVEAMWLAAVLAALAVGGNVLLAQMAAVTSENDAGPVRRA